MLFPQWPGRAALLRWLLASNCCVVLLVFVGAYSAVLHNKFSPVYVDVDCGDEVISQNGGGVSGLSVTAGLRVALTCTNANPYELKIIEPKEGKIYLAESMSEIGVIAAQPSTLPMGDGQVTLDGEVRLSGFGALAMIGRVIAGPVHVFLEINFNVLIEQNLLVTSLQVSATFEKKCGATLDIRGGAAGGVVCGDSFEELVISDLGVKLHPSSAAMGVGQEVIDSATRDKNLYLGLAMGVSFSLAALLLLCDVAVLVRLLRMKRAPTTTVTVAVGTSIGARTDS